MYSRSYPRNVSWLCLLFTIPALAHMEMSWPYPFRSKFNPDNGSNDIDYSMTSPLLADGSNFPCKGYQNDDNIRTTAEYTAGSTYNMTLSGSATHLGGSCQISLSYDNAATFRVIKSMIGGCPLTSTYEFTIPSSAPSGEALLAWTWQNEEGNREYYMNCAAVNIVSRSTRRRRKRATSALDNLPYIWKANLKGVNNCATVEGEDPVYPDPGSDVLYSGKMDSSSSTTSGTCDSATPYGQTYKRAAGDTSDAATYVEASTETSSSGDDNSTSQAEDDVSTEKYESNEDYDATENHESNATADPESTSTPVPKTTAAPTFPAKLALVQSTTTITTDCGSTVFITMTSTRNTTIPRPTGMVTSAKPTPAPSSGTTPSNSSSSHPPFVSSNANNYLPCVPGTFICTDSSTWETCTSNDGSVSSSEDNVYLYPRLVAAGMECLPFYSTYSSSTQEYGQQANVPRGSYRDDRIVRARPDGDCDVNGSLQCTSGGQSFNICDQGGWVQMGSVAAGTVCQNGRIDAAS